ncbi:hypothetical protein SLEP1_g48745 [Rubroshorea leprosula]|uniref:Uncharacterized protein n=1 Tax=Rubroshorea leprosula TaxID=152421 RepID=A0AAV5LVH7_9ROSI|nr:hypothetical protein SLEP1_g48745 [Rubroshorea leprosula]
MLAIGDLLNPLLVKTFSMDEHFEGVLPNEQSRLTMKYHSFEKKANVMKLEEKVNGVMLGENE